MPSGTDVDVADMLGRREVFVVILLEVKQAEINKV